MNPKTELAIDLKMLNEYRAKPIGDWFGRDYGSTEVRFYENANQRLVALYGPVEKKLTVYSFAAEFNV